MTLDQSAFALARADAHWRLALEALHERTPGKGTLNSVLRALWGNRQQAAEACRLASHHRPRLVAPRASAGPLDGPV